MTAWVVIVVLVMTAIVAASAGYQLGVHRSRDRGWHVRVAPSHSGTAIKHTVSAQLVHPTDGVHHFQRVDMTEEHWEEQLAAAVADMKLKRAALIAADRIARE